MPRAPINERMQLHGWRATAIGTPLSARCRERLPVQACSTKRMLGLSGVKYGGLVARPHLSIIRHRVPPAYDRVRTLDSYNMGSMAADSLGDSCQSYTQRSHNPLGESAAFWYQPSFPSSVPLNLLNIFCCGLHTSHRQLMMCPNRTVGLRGAPQGHSGTGDP